MGPKASASQRKLRRENSVCKVTKTHSLQQSHPLSSLIFPLFLLTANFKIWQGVDNHTRWKAQCATHPGIEPHCAHSQECGHFLFSHLTKNPQQTPWGRKQGQTTHGLTQNSFLYLLPRRQRLHTRSHSVHP